MRNEVAHEEGVEETEAGEEDEARRLLPANLPPRLPRTHGGVTAPRLSCPVHRLYPAVHRKGTRQEDGQNGSATNPETGRRTRH